METGEWFPPEQTPVPTGALGLLVLEGVVVRSVSVGGRQGLELFGSGDLVPPFAAPDDVQPMVPAEVGWWALTPTKLAVLDARFTSRMCGYPEVIAQLSGRLERRSSTHALRLTIVHQPRLSTRVHLLLWPLADRFGSGSSGRDRSSGNSGNDRLAGNSANDRVSGDSGRDRINGGSGRDRPVRRRRQRPNQRSRPPARPRQLRQGPRPRERGQPPSRPRVAEL